MRLRSFSHTQMFQMALLRTLPCLLLLAASCRADKAVAGDSYENGVGTSFTVPLNPQAYTAQVIFLLR